MSVNGLKSLNPEAKKNIQAIQLPGQNDVYQNLLTVYLKTSEQFLNEIQGATFEQAKLIAHSWRSSSAAMGAEILADLCSKIEAALDPQTAQSLIQQAADEYKNVKSALMR